MSLLLSFFFCFRLSILFIYHVDIFGTQPKTPLQVATSLSTSSSCDKSVKIRFVAICHLQTCYNLLNQFANSLLMTSYNNQLVTSLVTTCNRPAVTSRRKPCERILISACCNKLLQDVNRLVTTFSFLAL